MSSEMMFGKSVGFVSGIILGLILVVIIFKFANKDKKVNSQYDERQELIRGKGYKYAFWTMTGCVAVSMMVDMLFPVLIPMYFCCFASIMIAGVVLALYCIKKGAYWGLNNNRKRYITVFVIAGLINAAAAITSIINGQMIVDGIIQAPSINLMCGLMLLIIGIAIAVDSSKSRKEEE